MKNLFPASMIAIAAASSLSIPAQAAKVVISTDNGHPDWKRHHRDHRLHCHTKVVKHWRHHRVFIEKVRVCDRYDNGMGNGDGTKDY